MPLAADLPSATSPGAADLTDALEATGALRTGHFKLSSGLHAGRYFQCARLLAHPDRAEAAGRALAAEVRALGIGPVDLVVGPALGGVIVAHELARALGTPAYFTERDAEGTMRLKRFEAPAGSRVVVVEDVVTTGKSAREAAAALTALGLEVVAMACLVDRSGGSTDFGVPLASLLSLPVVAWDPAGCPKCAAGEPLEKPGSRPDARQESK